MENVLFARKVEISIKFTSLIVDIMQNKGKKVSPGIIKNILTLYILIKILLVPLLAENIVYA